MSLIRMFTTNERKTATEVMEILETLVAEMGMEIHDDLIQKLSILRLHLDKIERSSYDPVETKNAVIRMQADFQQVTDSIRRISHRLAPVKSESDTFQRRIELLCQNLDTPGTIRIHPSFDGSPRNLPTMSENYLLRMVQELIHNSFRHSAAWNVWVTINWKSEQIEISVEDDGSGFSRIEDFVDKIRKRHNTLRMRARAIGAKITYQGGQKGLLARVIFPYNS